MTMQPVAVPSSLWQSELLAQVPSVRHGVTGRVPGLGLADGNVGFSAPRDRADAWRMRQHWCAAAGLDAARLVTLGQIHGSVAHVVRRGDAGRGARPGSEQIGLGDALITNQPGPVLMTLHADCQALLFVDPGSPTRAPAVGVAHAGWRGTVADVAGATVVAMTAAFGTQPQDLLVSVGPAIGGCCYAVGSEVIEAWQALAGADWRVAVLPGGHTHFSLRDANAYLLQRAGVLPANIERAAVCTQCDGDRWFSHRGQGAATGRFGALITIAEEDGH
ncbi:MAG: laccase domain-containing protein [Thermomicrobiales bacterium]|nr:laccase domain-containing protein [Thermomicrobiales bacterium]